MQYKSIAPQTNCGVKTTMIPTMGTLWQSSTSIEGDKASEMTTNTK